MTVSYTCRVYSVAASVPFAPDDDLIGVTRYAISSVSTRAATIEVDGGAGPMLSFAAHPDILALNVLVDRDDDGPGPPAMPILRTCGMHLVEWELAAEQIHASWDSVDEFLSQQFDARPGKLLALVLKHRHEKDHSPEEYWTWLRPDGAPAWIEPWTVPLPEIDRTSPPKDHSLVFRIMDVPT